MNVQDEFYHPVATPVQTGIREGYQAKKRGQPKIFYRHYGIVYGDLLGIYAIFLSQYINYPGAP